MKVIKPSALSLLTRCFEFHQRCQIGLAIAAFVPLGEAALLPETAMWKFLAEELPPDQPLDVGIPKSRPEFLAVAKAFAPDGSTVTRIRTEITLGTVTKRLDAFGDRTFRDERFTDAIPFAQMPLDWVHSFGGNGIADNPSGKGAALGKTRDPVKVQNVVNPDAPHPARTPASYMPLDQMWPARAKRAGTYNDAWLKTDFPGFPNDIDWRFFNLAQPDQWLPGPLAGNEQFALANLNPLHRRIEGWLPGLVPRLFLVRKDAEGDSGFEEVPMALTTVWFFPHRERMVLVYHGSTRIAEEDASDIARAVIGADRLGELSPAAHFRAVMDKRTAKGGAIHALNDADLVPAEWLRPDPALAGSPEEKAAMKEVRARSRRRAEREQGAAAEKLKAQGLDPAKYKLPQLPPPEREPPTLAELPAFAAAMRKEAEQKKAEALALLEQKKAEAAKQMADAGLPQEEIEKRLAPQPKGPPAFTAAGTRAQIETQLKALSSLGRPTRELEAKLLSPAAVASWEKAEAAARNGYRLSAHFQASAGKLPPERSAEIRRLIASDSAAARRQYDLHGADLSGLDLSGADLSGAALDGADLTGTNFTGANLRDVVLAHAKMRHCLLDGADLGGANLGKADLTNASLIKATLKKAVLAGANLVFANLSGAVLEGVDLSEAKLGSTDFTSIAAPQLLAMKLSLRGLNAKEALLRKAKFLYCDLRQADFTSSTLEGALFLDCNLEGSQFDSAKMKKAVFVKSSRLANANLAGADLTEANLRDTDLEGVDLIGAILGGADFSRCNLRGAILSNVRARAARFVAANLAGADLSGGNFAGADLSGADLRGADLSHTSAYEANFSRARHDGETRRRGMQLTRMRYLPLYRPPEPPP